MSTKSGSVQHAAACSRLAVLLPWMVKVECGRLRDRWSKRYTGGYTARPPEKCLCYSPNMRLPKASLRVELVKRGLAVPQPRSW